MLSVLQRDESPKEHAKVIKKRQNNYILLLKKRNALLLEQVLLLSDKSKAVRSEK